MTVVSLIVDHRKIEGLIICLPWEHVANGYVVVDRIRYKFLLIRIKLSKVNFVWEVVEIEHFSTYFVLSAPRKHVVMILVQNRCSSANWDLKYLSASSNYVKQLYLFNNLYRGFCASTFPCVCCSRSILCWQKAKSNGVSYSSRCGDVVSICFKSSFSTIKLRLNSAA